MGALEIAAALAAVLSLPLLTYTLAKPRVNRWAAVKFLRIYHEIDGDDLYTREQARSLPFRRRLRRWWRRVEHRSVQWLMTRHDRIRHRTLIDQLGPVGDRMSARSAPPDGCDPLVAEAVALSMARLEARDRRKRKRSHRDVSCCVCSIRYGKRRSDYNIISSGNWMHPTAGCQDPTDRHYCAMCWVDQLHKRAAAGEDNSR